MQGSQRSALAIAILVTALGAACTDAQYRLVLVYPDQDAFDMARFAELYFRQDVACDELRQVIGSPDLTFDPHSALPNAGRYPFGRVAFRVAVRKADCQRFLDGCVEAEIASRQDATIRIELATTSGDACAVGGRCLDGNCLYTDGGALDARPTDGGDAANPDVRGLDVAIPDVPSADRRDAAVLDIGGPDVAVDSSAADRLPADRTTADIVAADQALSDLMSGDAALPDTGLDATLLPDVAASDVTSSDQTAADAAVATCDQLFGTASGYLLCSEAADRCEFAILINGLTCADLCQSFGRGCVGAFGNVDPNRCTHVGTETCSMARTDEICVCARS